MSRRVLVAGVGNLFLSDDGFGPEVVRRLSATDRVPAHARVVDYGIRGMHLAYDLLEGYDALVIVDAVPGRSTRDDGTSDDAPTGGHDDTAPGDLTVLEVREEDLGSGDYDAHGMDPVAVLASLERIGGTLPPTYIVGCRAATVDEGIGLSAAVEAAVPAAVEAVLELLATRLSPQTAFSPVEAGEPALGQEV